MPGSRSTETVIRAALEEFNQGRQDALGAPRRPGGRRPQALLGCSASRTCSAQRPIPVPAGSGELSLVEIREVGEHRAVCNLVTENGIRLVGLYAVHDGRITAACHYISDTDMLTELGVLPLAEPSDETGHELTPSAGAARPPASPSLSDSLLDARLAHRQRRLRLAIHALDLRVESLSCSGAPIPPALTAAIQWFQQELDDTQREQTEPFPRRRAHRPSTTAALDWPNRASPLGIDDVYPGTTLVGSCTGCRSLLFADESYEWQNLDTHELCLPDDDDATLYCGRCSEH